MTSNAASPAPSASAVPPEQLAVAARALGGDELHSFMVNGRRQWQLLRNGEFVEHIGSDADLMDRLLDTMTNFRLERFISERGFRCNNYENGVGSAWHDTKLAAVIACIAAMGAK
jgi:hypothetical protein